MVTEPLPYWGPQCEKGGTPLNAFSRKNNTLKAKPTTTGSRTKMPADRKVNEENRQRNAGH